LLVACLLGVGSAGAQPAAGDFWQRQNIYQIITDRFYDGDPANNNADGNYDPAGHRGTSVHGGDFKGIEQKLDYIQALGATAIWISPIVVNGRGEFHGYAGRDFYHVDPHWGSLADLQHLVRAAHARGMLVIDDIIVNHGGNLLDSGDAGYGRFKYPPGGYKLRFRNPARQYAPPFELNATNTTLEALFHNQGLIQDYQSATQVELGSLSGLDDFRTESDYVRQRMTEIYEYWIDQAGFDGYRVDTVKHVEMGFWQAWCPAIHAHAATRGDTNFFMFGEVYDGSDAKCGSYTGTKGGGPFKLDSVLDYPLYFRVNQVLARATASPKQLADRYAAIPAHYDPCAWTRLVTFLDNHDQPRFLSARNANNRADRLKVALVFLYTAPGIPCLYYGTEQGFNGDNDPYDREDMFAGQFEQGPSLGDNFNLTHPLFLWVARLNNLRRLYPALETGTHSVLWSDPAGPGLFACARRLDTQEVLVVLNTANTSRTLPACPTIYPPGTRLVNLLDTNDVVTVADDAGGAGGASHHQTPPIVVPGTTAKVFLAQSQRRPLDPVVNGITPSHDASGVAGATPIVMQFSQPMDPASVEAAFATVPASTGAISWTSAHDRMTFTPAGAGFPPETMVSVRLAAGARAAAGDLAFHAGFESRFRTEAPKRAVPPP